MSELITLKCDPLQVSKCTQKIIREINKGNWVRLLHHLEDSELPVIPSPLLPKEPGIIISSSGSTGGRHYCLQPFSNLNQSAFATGEWLKEEGIDPKQCKIYNPLPINHVSGLMLWWRSRYWGVTHEWIKPSLMRKASELAKSKKLKSNNKTPLILALVPTQLKRLLQNNDGIRWLQSFSVIWVGGSPLPKKLEIISRKEGIRLAPCYGTTETMAMVTALSPDDFLKGQTGVGRSLIDIELRLKPNNKGLQIRSSRLAVAIWDNDRLINLPNKNGWWDSGDSAEIRTIQGKKNLKISGRLDNAIHSGGETIFPDKLQEQLIKAAKNIQIPIESILLAPIKDEEWDERLIALIRLKKDYSEKNTQAIFNQLKGLVTTWMPAEKPCAWYHCQILERNSLGKWDLKKWISWAHAQQPIF